MTIVASRKPRRHRLPPWVERLFEVEPNHDPSRSGAGTRLLAHCHWQRDPRSCPTIVLVHGLEGSSDSSYMKGIAEKALAAGFNAIRLNQRNCGGSERLTTTLYHSGMSGDYRAVLFELAERDALPEIFFGGFSMGGNLVLKMAGELGAATPAALAGVAAVAPTVQLSPCVHALEKPQNALYQWMFVRNLKSRFRRKVRQLPDRYQLDGLPRLRTVRDYDQHIIAPHFGFRDAEDYYHRSSAIHTMGEIRVPTLILASRDDSFVPPGIYAHPAILNNSCIRLVLTEHGGHCGFISDSSGDERYWAEARVVEFCRENSALAGRKG